MDIMASCPQTLVVAKTVGVPVVFVIVAATTPSGEGYIQKKKKRKYNNDKIRPVVDLKLVCMVEFYSLISCCLSEKYL